MPRGRTVCEHRLAAEKLMQDDMEGAPMTDTAMNGQWSLEGSGGV